MKNSGIWILVLTFILFSACETSSPYELYVTFSSAQHLKVGDEVKSREVRIGTVESLSLQVPNEVLVKISVDPKFKIPQGSEASIRSVGLLSAKKFMNINFSESESYYDHKDTLGGLDSDLLDFDFNLEELGLNSFQESLTKLGEVLEDVDTTMIRETLEKLKYEIKSEDLDRISKELSEIELEDFDNDFEAYKSEIDKIINKESEIQINPR